MPNGNQCLKERLTSYIEQSYRMKEPIDKPIKSFINNLPQVGSLTWIGIRPVRKEPLKSLETVGVSVEAGLEGDHFASKFSKKRQVTLIQEEHLSGVASMLVMEKVDPALTRRNLVIQGINLFALRDRVCSALNLAIEFGISVKAFSFRSRLYNFG